MALTYDGSGGLFTDLGKIIKMSNAQSADAAGLDADLDEILDAFQVSDLDELLTTIVTSRLSWEAEYETRRSTLATLAQNRLLDKVTVLAEIGAPAATINDVLKRLIETMTADSETVNASVVSIGSITANANNTGDGTVITLSALDGISIPISGGIALPSNSGLTTELCKPSQNFEVRCTSDSYQGATEGSETFQWSGEPATNTWVHSGDTEGDGIVSGSLAPITADTVVTNGDFEDFTVANTPDDWDIDNGTVGVHILKETTNFYHGAAGLKFVGDNSQSDIEVSQSITTMDADRYYLLAVRYYCTAADPSAVLTIRFEGTGYTAGSGAYIQKTTDHATSFTLATAKILTPKDLPSDWQLVIKWNGTPAAQTLYIDDLAVAPFNFGAGHGIAIVRGATPFVAEDRFTYSVSSTEGVIQRFFRRAYGVQLPSNAAGGETILDSLAT